MLVLLLSGSSAAWIFGCANDKFGSASSDGSVPDSAFGGDAASADGAPFDATPGALSLVGSAVDQTAVDHIVPGGAEAFRFTADASGSGGVFHIFLDATSTCSAPAVGIYSGSATGPQSLLGLGHLAAPVAGQWNAFPAGTPTPIVQGTVYWLAVLCPNTASGTLVFHDVPLGTGPDNSQACSDTNLGSLPGAWSTGTLFPKQSPLAAYVSAN